MTGKSDRDQLIILQEALELNPLPDNYVERQDGERQTGFFNGSLSLSKLFNAVYKYIFE